MLKHTRGERKTEYIITNGLVAHPMVRFLPHFFKKAQYYLKKHRYILADKAYDDTDIIAWIMKRFNSKAGIPIRKKSNLTKGKRNRYGNLFNWKLKAVGRTFKHSILKLRTEIERFFSSLKRTFHLGKESTRGIEAFTKNAYLFLISYCLKKFYLIGVRYV